MADTPRYIKVAKALKDAIIKGEYREGELLPSENELSEQYRLNRMTIRNALKTLENEGFIHKHKGKGSIVKSKRKSFEILALKGFTEVMKRKGKHLKVETQFLDPVHLTEWPEDFHWELSREEVEPGCIKMTRTRFLEGSPVMLERTFFPNLHLQGFLDTPFVNNALFDTLIVNHNIEMVSVEQKIRAIPADKYLAEALKLDQGSPVLEIIRKLHTSKSNFHVYTYAYCNTTDFSLEI